MAKAQTSFNKKENEKKRQQKRNDKEEKRKERQANAVTGQGLEEMMAYVDENGNITSTPPDPTRKRKIGVFFCGAPIIGRILADLCHRMTLRGREDGSLIEYHFQIEVFG